MGTISTYKKRDGSISYTARVRIVRDGKRVFAQTETFDRKATAQAWLKKRETELSQPGVIEQANSPDPTLGEIITRYLAESVRQSGRTKTFTLRAMAKTDIAKLRASQVASHHLVGFARDRVASGTSPATVYNDLILMGGLFAIAKPGWGYPLDPKALEEATTVCWEMGYVARPSHRERRPTLAELDMLMAYFRDLHRRRPWSCPMLKIVAFAIFSARRQEEIARLRWDDMSGQRILVRAMKHPRKKQTNDVWVYLPDEAFALLNSMPKAGPRIFPYGAKGISAAFTRACKWLGINNLHFHDLRHEAISRLFEMDWHIHRVAEVSGHRSWESLRIYTHLERIGDKYADWPWLPVALAQKNTRHEAG